LAEHGKWFDFVELDIKDSFIGVGSGIIQGQKRKMWLVIGLMKR